ncbi:MAG TPA: hypothetical protein PL033_19100 [Candidatus Brocadiia bacterium]|nr:hypothetical protein [Candidatus Brocadiia bacterium]
MIFPVCLRGILPAASAAEDAIAAIMHAAMIRRQGERLDLGDAPGASGKMSVGNDFMPI